MKLKIKVSFIANRDEAEIAINLGADALGLCPWIPGVEEILPDSTLAEIAQTIPPPIATFLHTAENAAMNIINHNYRVHANTIQILDTLKDGLYEQIRSALPNVRIVQTFPVNEHTQTENIIELSHYVDAVLLDCGTAEADTLEQEKDESEMRDEEKWVLCKEIIQEISVPAFLAGNLHAGNIRQAVETVRPFAVDVGDKLRTGGALDVVKLQECILALNPET